MFPGALTELLLLDLTEELEGEARLATMKKLKLKVMMNIITAFIECRKEVTDV